MPADLSPVAPTTRPAARPRPSRRKTKGLEVAQRAAPLRNGKEAAAAAALERELTARLEQVRHIAPLRDILKETIAQVHAVATRDREADYGAVERAVFVMGCRTVIEIVEEIREERPITRWIVQGVLDEMVMQCRVAVREKSYLAVDGIPEGERALEYHPL